MEIQEEIRSELVRLDVPITSLGGFQFDSSQEPKEVRVDYEGVTSRSCSDIRSPIFDIIEPSCGPPNPSLERMQNLPRRSRHLKLTREVSDAKRPRAEKE